MLQNASFLLKNCENRLGAGGFAPDPILTFYYYPTSPRTSINSLLVFDRCEKKWLKASFI